MCFVCRVVPIFDNALWQEVQRRIEADFGTQDLDRRLEWVKECLEKRDHMTVFRIDGSDSAKDIDLAILQALLKGLCVKCSTLFRTLDCGIPPFLPFKKNTPTLPHHFSHGGI